MKNNKIIFLVLAIIIIMFIVMLVMDAQNKKKIAEVQATVQANQTPAKKASGFINVLSMILPIL